MAATAGPTTSALSALRPVGKSIATTGFEQAFRSAMMVSTRPVAGLESPVPRIASTIRSAPRTSDPCSSQLAASAISTTSISSARKAPRFTRASPRTSPDTPIRNTDVSMPRSDNVRATTNPSPPLFPLPHSTAMCRLDRSSNVASIEATTCLPAFSISTSDGIPISSVVRLSASRICWLVRTRMNAERAYRVC